MLQPVLPCEQPAPLSVGRRGAARLRLAIPARLHAIHLNADCILLDLSRTGARIGVEKPLASGELLYLQIARLNLFAEVVRLHCGESGGVNGLVFDEPLTEAEVLAVRHHAETFEQRQQELFRDQARRWVSGESHI